MSLADTFVAVRPDTSKFGGELRRKIDGPATKAGADVGHKMGTSLAKRAALAIGSFVALDKAKDFFLGAISAASDTAEAQSKVGVVFKSSAKDIRAASEESASAVGLSKRAYLDATGTLGNLFVALGRPPAAAAKMSKTMVQLAGDLASFNNVSPEEALDALRSGLVGETEPLRKFGVNLNDATLRQEAMSLGLVKTTKEVLPPAVKSQAAYSLILKQTKTAQGDFQRTSSGLANQQRILTARWDNAKAVLGEKLLPVVNRVVSSLSDFVQQMLDGKGAGGKFVDALKAVVMWVGRNKTAVKALIIAMTALYVITKLHAAYLAVQGAGGLLKYLRATKLITAATRTYTAVQWLLNAATTAALGPVGLVIIAIAALAAGLIYAYKHSETFRKIVNAAWKGVQKGASFMWEHVLKPVFRFITKAWLSVAGSIVHGAAKMLGWVPGVGPKLRSAAKRFDEFKDRVNRALDRVKDRKVDVTAQWGSKFQTLVNISGKRYRVGGVTHLASGGPVRGPGTGTSDDVPIMGSNGEHMWTAREVMAAGGHSAVKAIRKAVLRGYAGGGEISVRPHTRGIAAANRDMSILNRLVGHAVAFTSRTAVDKAGLFGAFPTGAGGSGVSRWSGVVLRALALLHQSSAWLGTVLSRMNRESGGNPRAINLWDSNAAMGDPSRGLMQTIGSTFAAYAGPFRGLGIYNPLANVYAGLNYALHRYGSLAALNRPGGYDTGGMLNPGQLGMNYGSRPERVLSAAQTASFDRLVAALTTGSVSASPRELVVKDANGELIGRMRIEASNVLDSEIRAARLGGF